MRKLHVVLSWLLLAALLAGLAPALAAAQEGQPTETPPSLTMYSDYPSMVIGIGEDVTITLRLKAQGKPQVAHLDLRGLPEGWTATFKGGGRAIKAVYVPLEDSASVSLTLELPDGVAPGNYAFAVTARSDVAQAEWPLEIVVKEKAPSRLSFDTDLPIVTGSPNTTFRFTATLKNEGDEDLMVNLTSEVPSGFGATFRVGGQETTSFPLEANQSKTVSIEVKGYSNPAAGDYPITVRADAGNASASLTLTVRVTGNPDLKISAPNGRLSADAYAGKETTVKVLISNEGSAPARGVRLSSSTPANWTVEFDPKEIAEIPAGQEVEVTAKVRPAEKAVAGDYMVTVRASTEGTATESADFRITVRTSTLWGVVGVALIAIAVGVVALAVMRFGRR
ncbi:MAG: NEW3 domain-containing protein [Anaerolineae bacterium]